MTTSKPTHGGKRDGAGRKPAPFPMFLKKLRATEEERVEFSSFMTGDARLDFLRIMYALDEYKDAHPHLFKK